MHGFYKLWTSFIMNEPEKKPMKEIHFLQAALFLCARPKKPARRIQNLWTSFIRHERRKKPAIEF